MTWGRVTLRAGSLHSICEMSPLRAGDTAGLLGKAMGCVRMTLYSPIMLGCLNGTVPAETSNWYVILLASHSADCVFGGREQSSEMKQECFKAAVCGSGCKQAKNANMLRSQLTLLTEVECSHDCKAAALVHQNALHQVPAVLTIDEHVQADAKSPDVGHLPMVGGPLTHLRGEKGRGAHGAHSSVSMVHHPGTAKVADLHTPIGRKQHVIWLQVAMHNALLV